MVQDTIKNNTESGLQGMLIVKKSILRKTNKNSFVQPKNSGCNNKGTFDCHAMYSTVVGTMCEIFG